MNPADELVALSLAWAFCPMDARKHRDILWSAMQRIRMRLGGEVSA